MLVKSCKCAWTHLQLCNSCVLVGTDAQVAVPLPTIHPSPAHLPVQHHTTWSITSASFFLFLQRFICYFFIWVPFHRRNIWLSEMMDEVFCVLKQTEFLKEQEELWFPLTSHTQKVSWDTHLCLTSPWNGLRAGLWFLIAFQRDGELKCLTELHTSQ